MFRTRITEAPFLGWIANESFGNIQGDQFLRDYSMVATLRALLAPRIAEGESVDFTCSGFCNRHSVVENNSAETIILSTYNFEREYPQGLHLVNITRYDDDEDWAFDFFVEEFSKIEGYERIDKVTAFYQKAFNVACFVNPTTKRSVLFAEDLTVQRFHYLQCGILAYLPWYFDKEDGVTEAEMNLIKALRMKTSEEYIRCLDELLSQYDIRKMYTKRALANFEMHVEQNALSVAKSQYDDIIQKLEMLNSRISEALQSKREIDLRITGLEAKMRSDSEESEILDFFMTNPKLYLDRTSGSSITFCVKDRLTLFDEELAKTLIENERSVLYFPYGEGTDKPFEDVREVLKKIFIDEEFNIIFCSAYKFDIERISVEGLQSYQYDYEFNDAMPNPHIDRYSCLGDYGRYITDYLLRNDYIGAISQCIASAGSLNFADGPVMGEFAKTLHGMGTRNNRCIELPNGEVVNLDGAIEYLKAQNEEETRDENVEGE